MREKPMKILVLGAGAVGGYSRSLRGAQKARES